MRKVSVAPLLALSILCAAACTVTSTPGIPPASTDVGTEPRATDAGSSTDASIAEEDAGNPDRPLHASTQDASTQDASTQDAGPTRCSDLGEAPGTVVQLGSNIDSFDVDCKNIYIGRRSGSTQAQVVRCPYTGCDQQTPYEVLWTAASESAPTKMALSNGGLFFSTRGRRAGVGSPAETAVSFRWDLATSALQSINPFIAGFPYKLVNWIKPWNGVTVYGVEDPIAKGSGPHASVAVVLPGATTPSLSTSREEGTTLSIRDPQTAYLTNGRATWDGATVNKVSPFGTASTRLALPNKLLTTDGTTVRSCDYANIDTAPTCSAPVPRPRPGVDWSNGTAVVRGPQVFTLQVTNSGQVVLAVCPVAELEATATCNWQTIMASSAADQSPGEGDLRVDADHVFALIDSRLVRIAR
jgi:hypothetical protein